MGQGTGRLAIYGPHMEVGTIVLLFVWLVIAELVVTKLSTTRSRRQPFTRNVAARALSDRSVVVPAAQILTRTE